MFFLNEIGKIIPPPLHKNRPVAAVVFNTYKTVFIFYRFIRYFKNMTLLTESLFL